MFPRVDVPVETARVQQSGYVERALEECLEDLDTNLDGNISFNEYIDWNIRTHAIKVRRWASSLPQCQEQIFRRFDKNRDGSVSVQEFQVRRRARPSAAGRGPATRPCGALGAGYAPCPEPAARRRRRW
jgi:hypothetical protein